MWYVGSGVLLSNPLVSSKDTALAGSNRTKSQHTAIAHESIPI